MVSNECRIYISILCAILCAVGAVIYYHKEIEQYFDRTAKHTFREMELFTEFLIKKHYKSNVLCSKLSIHEVNNSEGPEVYRISWNQLTTMTLIRIKDGSVVSRAKRVSQSSYLFTIFGTTLTSGILTYNETNKEDFGIEYINDKNTHSYLIIVNKKIEEENYILPGYIYFKWRLMWLDHTPYFVLDDRQVQNVEMIAPSSSGFLQLKEKPSIDFFNPFPTMTPSWYIYELRLPKYLPVELYLTTLIIVDHLTTIDC